MYTVTDNCSAEDIYAIDKLCFPNEYWSIDTISRDIKSAIYLVCKCGMETIGYASASCVLDEAELTRIAVKASYRRKGIATLLINKLISTLRDKGCTVLMLEVRSRNDSALNLYDSLGFKAYACRKSYYHNPDDDAVLMSVKI